MLDFGVFSGDGGVSASVVVTSAQSLWGIAWPAAQAWVVASAAIFIPLAYRAARGR